MVVTFPGDVIGDAAFPEFMRDLALVHSLGLRLVLVPGARPQIERRLRGAKIKTPFFEGRRITSREALEHVKEAVGAIRVSVEAALSLGFVGAQDGNRLRVTSGNFVVAQPVGVLAGKDHLFTGDVRRIDRDGIIQQLDGGAVVVLSPIGFSLTGEAFNVASNEVALATAAALGADKYVAVVPGKGLTQGRARLDEISPEKAEKLLTKRNLGDEVRNALRDATAAVRSGVKRAHLIPWQRPGGLLEELFTEVGGGTMVARPWAQVRRATLKDAAGILQLIEPQTAAGLLVRRPRELLEQEIERFAVIERDGSVVACGALFAYREAKGTTGEVGALAVDPEYRSKGLGDELLSFLDSWARREGMKRLVALTTRATHWFLDRGFEKGSVRDLPKARKDTWSASRGSKVVLRRF